MAPSTPDGAALLQIKYILCMNNAVSACIQAFETSYEFLRGHYSG